MGPSNSIFNRHWSLTLNTNGNVIGIDDVYDFNGMTYPTVVESNWNRRIPAYDRELTYGDERLTFYFRFGQFVFAEYLEVKTRGHR